jgi:hypothetical protein
MSETVRVDLRHATLSESARLRESNGQAFLCLDNPPPVRSLLRITIGDEQRAFEVGKVIEVIDDTETERGCHGTFVALERLAEQQKAGSELLQPGNNSSGVPSPVVIMNTNEMLLAEAGSLDEELLAAARAEAESEQTTNDTELSEQTASSEQSASGDVSASEQTTNDTEPKTD